MTTIQKFEEALTTPDGPLDLLNPSDNVIIMVDEAHRSQYGDLGALMSKALPSATLIGFTGTPIEKGYGRSTRRRFGHLIDAYTIPQSVDDGATVPSSTRRGCLNCLSKARKPWTGCLTPCSGSSRRR